MKARNIMKTMLTALVAVGLAAGVTGCKDDNDIPFLKSDLHSFGPSPAERGKDISILGKNLNDVREVVFPVNVSVKEFTSRTNDKITVTVPEAAVPGQIKLVMSNGDIVTSRSIITFVEEVEVTDVAPLKVNVGDKVTVTGKFLYNVASIKFSNGYEMTPENFTEQTATTICFNAPADGASGNLVFSNGDDWEQEWDTPIEILAPAVEAVSETASDFGHSITLTGKNLAQIDKIYFPGQAEAYKEIAADGKSIKMTVPNDTKSGEVTAALKNGSGMKLFDVTLPQIEFEDITPVNNVVGGMDITITGKLLDRVTRITWPGGKEMTYGNWTVSADGKTIAVKTPQGVVDGRLVLVQNGQISVETKAISTPKEGNTIWVGNIEFGDWKGYLQIAEEVGDEVWDVFSKAITTTGTVTLHFTQDASAQWWQIQPVYRKDGWKFNFEGYPNVIELEQGQESCQIRVSQADLDELHNGLGWAFKGCNVTLKSVEWQADN